MGYKKPPIESRWTKGLSGNERGRPKGSRNLTTITKKILDEKIVVTVGGQRKHITKLEAAIINQTNKAVGGDHKSLRMMIELYKQACPPGSPSEPMKIVILGGLPDAIDPDSSDAMPPIEDSELD